MQHFLPNGQTLVIRKPTPEDAPAMLAYIRQLARETDFLLLTPAETVPLTVEDERAFIESYKDDNHHLLLLAVVDGELAGTVSVRQDAFRKKAHMGELGIGVLHRYWNLGIGRRLMTATLRWAEQHKELQIIYFSVVANNEKAIQLYRNFEFLECGRIPQGFRQQDGSYADLVMMSRQVKTI